VGWLLGTAGVVAALAAAAALITGLLLPLVSANRSAAVSVEHTRKVIDAIDQLVLSADDEETGQRGFLLTRDESYLEPYNRGSEQVERQLLNLRELTADNTRQQNNLQNLTHELSAKEAELDRTVGLVRAGDLNGAISVVREGNGKRLMDEIRRIAGDMNTEERRLMRERRDREEQSTRDVTQTLIATGILLSMFTIVAAVMAAGNARRVRTAVAERQRILDMVQLAAVMARGAEGNIQFWSEGCTRLYGWTAEQAIGQSARELLHTVFPVPFADIEAALSRDGAWNGELRQRTRDGTELIVSARKIQHDYPDGRGVVVVENMTDVTTLRQAEVALHDSEARLRLVQRVGGVAYSDRAYSETSILVSEEFRRLYGLPATRTHISTAEWIAAFHPEDRERVLAERKSVLEGGSTLATEFRICRPDGEVRWVAMRAEIFFGSDRQPRRVISAQQDITDIVAARETLAARQQELERRVEERTAALFEAQARFRSIFDAQFEHIALLTPDGTILEMNRTALDARGATREQAVGQLVWQARWWPDADRDRLRVEVSQAAKGALIRREAQIRNTDGRTTPIDLSLKPMRDETTGAVISIIAEARDQSEKHNLAAQLAQAMKVQALGQLAAGVAHDFNNILQAVSGAAVLIEQQPGDQDRIRHLARTAITAANRGASIVQRLLSFARRSEMRIEPIATGELLNAVREVLSRTLGSKITISTHFPDDIPWLIADQAQLETALINLATNARDAMPDGGTLTLSAEPDHVLTGEHQPANLAPGDYVRLTVTDTGMGMDAATLERVGEPFFTTKPPGQGTGLGLAMVKGFAEQSGGSISISSTPGAGTTVLIWLRQAKNVVDRAAIEEKTPKISSRISARILVVDDDDLVRDTVADQLAIAGFSTVVASGGIEALAMIEAGELVDAMVSDLSMPDISGVTTIQRVRELRPKLPCFLLTGYADERDTLLLEDNVTLLHKPVAGSILVAKIGAALQNAQEQRPERRTETEALGRADNPDGRRWKIS
jgi:PAS domain S-box-containing protein